MKIIVWLWDTKSVRNKVAKDFWGKKSRMEIIMYNDKKRDEISLGFKNVKDRHSQTWWMVFLLIS